MTSQLVLVAHLFAIRGIDLYNEVLNGIVLVCRSIRDIVDV
jgi:hypothetical protein